ncbi:hypothetical protein AB0F17_44255 [Nonomuraea sp. NPDC026600]|uniref:hypothetical protein n=1 Tax=Nonomuraea sp. NPDC026600 TaxID=3155363 RepID=UPI0033EF3F08
MRRALGAAILAMAAFGTTAALSTPAFAADDPSQPQLITSDQLTPILECAEPEVEHVGRFKVVKGEKVYRGEAGIRISEEIDGPEACGSTGKMTCLVKRKDGDRWQVRFRDEKGVVHKRKFTEKADAQRFTKKDKHIAKWIGCSVER